MPGNVALAGMAREGLGRAPVKGCVMFVSRGDSEFVVTIRAVDDEWEGKIVEHQLSRIVPTVHLCHNWTSYAAAVAGVRRRWQRLFPEDLDEDMPDFQEALVEPLQGELPPPLFTPQVGLPDR